MVGSGRMVTAAGNRWQPQWLMEEILKGKSNRSNFGERSKHHSKAQDSQVKPLVESLRMNLEEEWF
ncbi:uncharacterized protein G2W53_042911 [Senna tora]|uniref:Uncharacterized protein n=1 Tax=Senna tora TaxID=362788 RepID=A0A834SG41_9FABA|nr:uncharacterized protein G2W53_042911 [Senna tora]